MRLDRIDHAILKLLQQRTKLSQAIGEAKRRHGAMIYVPERERELLHRVITLSKGGLPSRSVAAIYREILSGSRAAQGQGAIGLLEANARTLLLPARWCFGACGEFVTRKSWPDLAEGLGKGTLALALLTGADLGRVLGPAKSRQAFLERFLVVSDLAPRIDQDCLLEDRIFIITPRAEIPDSKRNRILILIECKSRENAVKSWLNTMPDPSLEADALMFRYRHASNLLVRLSAEETIDPAKALGPVKGGVAVSILGIYGGPEDYGG